MRTVVRPSVLLVDDDQGSVDRLKVLFEKKGIHILTVSSFEMALTMIDRDYEELFIVFVSAEIPHFHPLMNSLKKMISRLVVYVLTAGSSEKADADACLFGAQRSFSRRSDLNKLPTYGKIVGPRILRTLRNAGKDAL